MSENNFSDQETADLETMKEKFGRLTSELFPEEQRAFDRLRKAGLATAFCYGELGSNGLSTCHKLPRRLLPTPTK